MSEILRSDMEALTQHLRRKMKSLVQEQKRTLRDARANYLNKLVDLLICDHIEWHTSKDLQVLSSHDPMRPVHSQPFVAPYGGRVRVSFSFSLPDMRGLFDEGVGISSTEVAG